MIAFDESLRRACLRRLARDWAAFNYWHLAERLSPPAFALDDAEARLGSWDHAARTITFSSRHVAESRWEDVLETLKHEMAHQYVDEVLGFEAALPHGEAFRRAKDLLAAWDRAPGAPADEAGEARIRRIRGLLALAKSPNRNEAEAALAKANELLLKYNIDAAATDAKRNYVYRYLGRPTGRRPRYLLVLAGLLADHFFVEVIWTETFEAKTGRAGQVLEVSGTPVNVDLADYAHGELLRSAHELWRKHRREQGLTSDRDRRVYIEGVLTGYSAKLRTQREEQTRRRELVWLGDPGLEEFFRTRHPKIRTERYACSTGTEAFSAGHEAGTALRLTRALGAHAGDRGRLLSG